jgi:hypothetical protein
MAGCSARIVEAVQAAMAGSSDRPTAEVTVDFS